MRFGMKVYIHRDVLVDLGVKWIARQQIMNSCPVVIPPDARFEHEVFTKPSPMSTQEEVKAFEDGYVLLRASFRDVRWSLVKGRRVVRNGVGHPR